MLASKGVFQSYSDICTQHVPVATMQRLSRQETFSLVLPRCLVSPRVDIAAAQGSGPAGSHAG